MYGKFDWICYRECGCRFADDSSDGKIKIIAINSGNGEMPKDGEGYGITPG